MLSAAIHHKCKPQDCEPPANPADISRDAGGPAGRNQTRIFHAIFFLIAILGTFAAPAWCCNIFQPQSHVQILLTWRRFLPLYMDVLKNGHVQ